MELLLVPLTIALVEAIKQLNIPSRLLPWCAVAVGVGLTFLTQDCVLKECILQGVITGLTASGLYDATLQTAKLYIKNKKA